MSRQFSLFLGFTLVSFFFKSKYFHLPFLVDWVCLCAYCALQHPIWFNLPFKHSHNLFIVFIANFERAHRYHDTALRHLEGLRVIMRKSTWEGVVEMRMEQFLDRMEMLLYEGMAQFHLIRGNPDECLKQVYEVKIII